MNINNNKIVILGIETSCDDTACSVMINGEIKSNIILNQNKLHSKYGGIVPQIAATEHFKNIDVAISKALNESKVTLSNITHIAYTKYPGLISSLLIGKIAAEMLHYFYNAKIYGINHLHAHAFSPIINKNIKDIKFPIISLVISGGHTNLYYIKSPKKIISIAETKDDAIGECFDKIGNYLNLPYPGGANIDKIISSLNLSSYKNLIPFSIYYCHKNKLRFSFSGLKTNVMEYIKRNQILNKELICLSLFTAAFKQLINVIKLFLKDNPCKELWIGGGVSASKYIRLLFKNFEKKNNIKIKFPELNYSTDNGAMVASLLYNELIWNKN